jgi:predicted nuclease of predicted toxin-antitoxin system
MKFLVDAQLPSGLCNWLEERAHEAAYVASVLSGDRSDDDIARFAAEHDLIVVTKDHDFLTLQPRYGHALLWLRCGNMRNALLYDWLEPRWSLTEASLAEGERLVEIRLVG